MNTARAEQRTRQQQRREPEQGRQRVFLACFRHPWHRSTLDKRSSHRAKVKKKRQQTPERISPHQKNSHRRIYEQTNGKSPERVSGNTTAQKAPKRPEKPQRAQQATTGRKRRKRAKIRSKNTMQLDNKTQPVVC